MFCFFIYNLVEELFSEPMKASGRGKNSSELSSLYTSFVPILQQRVQCVQHFKSTHHLCFHLSPQPLSQPQLHPRHQPLRLQLDSCLRKRFTRRLQQPADNSTIKRAYGKCDLIMRRTGYGMHLPTSHHSVLSARRTRQTCSSFS